MNEPGICPVCWAFQDPNTGKCLVCDKAYVVLDINPQSLNSMGILTDYAIPIKDKGSVGFLTIRGYPMLSVDSCSYGEQKVTFSIEAHSHIGDKNIPFSLHLI